MEPRIKLDNASVVNDCVVVGREGKRSYEGDVVYLASGTVPSASIKKQVYGLCIKSLSCLGGIEGCIGLFSMKGISDCIVISFTYSSKLMLLRASELVDMTQESRFEAQKRTVFSYAVDQKVVQVHTKGVLVYPGMLNETFHTQSAYSWDTNLDILNADGNGPSIVLSLSDSSIVLLFVSSNKIILKASFKLSDQVSCVRVREMKDRGLVCILGTYDSKLLYCELASLSYSNMKQVSVQSRVCHDIEVLQKEIILVSCRDGVVYYFDDFLSRNQSQSFGCMPVSFCRDSDTVIAINTSRPARCNLTNNRINWLPILHKSVSFCIKFPISSPRSYLMLTGEKLKIVKLCEDPGIQSDISYQDKTILKLIYESKRNKLIIGTKADLDNGILSCVKLLDPRTLQCLASKSLGSRDNLTCLEFWNNRYIAIGSAFLNDDHELKGRILTFSIKSVSGGDYELQYMSQIILQHPVSTMASLQKYLVVSAGRELYQVKIGGSNKDMMVGAVSLNVPPAHTIHVVQDEIYITSKIGYLLHYRFKDRKLNFIAQDLVVRQGLACHAIIDHKTGDGTVFCTFKSGAFAAFQTSGRSLLPILYISLVDICTQIRTSTAFTTYDNPLKIFKAWDSKANFLPLLLVSAHNTRFTIVRLSKKYYEVLYWLQKDLEVHCKPLLGNTLAEFRKCELGDAKNVLDGLFIAQFLGLDDAIQEEIAGKLNYERQDLVDVISSVLERCK